MQSLPVLSTDGYLYEKLVKLAHHLPNFEGNVEPKQCEDQTTPPEVQWPQGQDQWDIYLDNLLSKYPANSFPDLEISQLRSATLRLILARAMATELISHLLTHIPNKQLWSMVQKPEYRELLYTSARGFKRAPGIMKQVIVRNRMADWYQHNSANNLLLLGLWAQQEPRPGVLGAVESAVELGTVDSQLASLAVSWGVDNLFCALAWHPVPVSFLDLQAQLEDVETFGAQMEAAREILSIDEAPSLGDEDSIDTSALLESNEAPHWQQKCQQLEEELAQLRQTMHALLTRAEYMQTEALKHQQAMELASSTNSKAVAQLEKKLDHQGSKSKVTLDKLTHELERTGRKLRAAEREKSELDVENKRFKKQLRHVQQLLEVERKKNVNAESSGQTQRPASKVEAVSTPPATPATPTRPVVVAPPTPLDELFEWRADGRLVRITPRAVKRLIDGNEEDNVYSIMQALDALNGRNQEQKDKFLGRLRQAGAFYPNVLTKDTTRILVDASNVARHTPNRYGKGQIQFLYQMRQELRDRNCFPIIFVADASLPYYIDDPKELRAMMLRGEITMADKGTEADELLAREARRTGAYVVTNDRLFFSKVSPDFEPPRVTFRIYDGTVIVDEF